MPHLALPTSTVFVVVVALSHSAIAQTEERDSLTLDEAVTLALSRSPRLAAARADVELEEADVAAARVFPENPSLELQAGPRLEGDVLGVDASLGVTQALPLFGRWGAAIDVAETELTAERSRLRFEEQRLAAEVMRAFIEAQRAEELRALQGQRASLVQNMVELTQTRVEAGDATQLDVNVWIAELGTARAALRRLDAAALASRARLASLIGLDPRRPPRASGKLTPPSGAPGGVVDVEDFARRPDLEALERRIEAAQAAVALARARAWPDIGVGAYAGTEKLAPGPTTASAEYFAGAQLVVPMPVFDRNQGGVARAEAQLKRAKATRAAALLQARAEIEAERARFEAALAATRGLSTSVLGPTAETLTLLQRSFAEGKIGIGDLLLRQRTLLDAQADYFDAVADARIAEVNLNLALGRVARPDTEGAGR